MEKFEFFNKFNNPVLIVNSNIELVYKNNVFKRCFQDFKSLKNFLHKINYNICPLDSEDTEIISPIIQAVRSKESFDAHISYQVMRKFWFFMKYPFTITRQEFLQLIIWTIYVICYIKLIITQTLRNHYRLTFCASTARRNKKNDFFSHLN